MKQKLKVALVGLGFGREFIPIWQNHPNSEVAAICQRKKRSLNKVGDDFGVERRYDSFEAMLQAGGFDIVHINTAIPDHEQHSIMALEAGFHVMCTVPMATTVEGCERVCDAVKRTGKKYMMAETTVFSREVLYLKHLLETGQLGKLQHIVAQHPQIMTGWPKYWEAMLPMLYATHVVFPCITLIGRPVEMVVGMGSGRVPKRIADQAGCDHAFQNAMVQFQGSPVTAYLSRTLGFNVAVQYRESVDVFGSKKSFLWEHLAGAGHNFHRYMVQDEEGIPKAVGKIPDFARLLPKSIRQFTQPAKIHDAGHRSFVQGGGHGGSHPHLVHNFLMGLLENSRAMYPQATLAANGTCAGILANDSAQHGSKPIHLPSFTLG